MSQKSKFAWKYRQANLPDAAYSPSFDAFGYYAEQATDEKTKQRYCKNHPFSFWGKAPDGEYYKRCVLGNKNNEDCEIGL